MSTTLRNEAPNRCFGISPGRWILSAPTSEILVNRGRNLTRPVQDETFLPPSGCDDHDRPRSTSEAITRMEKVGWLLRYPARAPIFHHGDPANSVYIVRQGKLKLSLTSRRGRCAVFRFAAAGDLLGLSAVLNHADHQYLAQTLEPSVPVNVPRNEFLHLLQTAPEVSSFATLVLARDHDAMLRAIRRLGMSASVRERLAQLLMNCVESSRADSLSPSIRMNWTYAELGDMVNSSRETVTRIMTQFEREELIMRRGSLVVIRNPSKLQLLAS